MTLRSPRTRLLCQLMLLVVLLSLFFFRGFLPGWRSLNTDFPNYFLAAAIHRAGTPLDRAYEWEWFQRQKDHLRIEQPLVGFAPHPPLCALPFMPLAGISAINAKRVWLVLNLGFLALVFWILQRETKFSWLQVVLIALLCIAPLRSNLLDGQYYIFILLLICAAYRLRLNHRFFSGLLLSIGAGLKLFPGVFVILFLWKRDWRAAGGLIFGFLALILISVWVFGSNVHQVYATEVLPRALRGELLAPYSLRWSSFSALWHRAFLFEPELNPTPLVNSPVLFSIFQAVTSVVLWFGFFAFVNRKDASGEDALEWSAFVPLLLLLNPMPSSYQYCVLIFSAVVGFSALQKFGNEADRILLIGFFVAACFPPFGGLAAYLPPARLIATVGMFVMFLRALSRHRKIRFSKGYACAAVAVSVVFFVSSLRALAYRGEDFQRRVSVAAGAFRYADPVALPNHEYLVTEMVLPGYVAALLKDQQVAPLPLPGDALWLAGSEKSSDAYLETAAPQSSIYRLGVTSGVATGLAAEGEQPAISANGKWLAFLREEGAQTSVWLADTTSRNSLELMYKSGGSIFEMAVTPDGDLILAEGSVVFSRLTLVKRQMKTIAPMLGILGSVRYPALSSDGSQLAFSRRDRSSWHLIVRDLGSGAERQLTRGACNALSPTWVNSNTLLYATDCGRGLGLSAIARVDLGK